VPFPIDLAIAVLGVLRSTCATLRDSVVYTIAFAWLAEF